jgi:large subunit ribosomal protein L23
MSRSRARNLLTSPYSVLRRPVLTEKTHALLPVRLEAGKEQQGQYVFEVHVKATKPQIKRAIEIAFGVDVESVNTLIVKPRTKSFRMARRGSTGMTRTKKRALVRLAKGSKSIELV